MQGRANLACRICRRNKVRCSTGQPCDRCGRLGLDCEYPGESSASPARVKRKRTQVQETRPPTPDDPEVPLAKSPILDENVNPPFSTFTYTGEPTSQPTLDVIVPPLARPAAPATDPIQLGILSEEFASWLFDFYMEQCAILPLPLSLAEYRRRSPFLVSTILSVAYVNVPLDFCSHVPLLGELGNERLSEMLCNVATNSLATILLQRSVGLEDLVGVLNMSLWNVTRVAARGPSSWPMIGYAQRIARRFFIHESRPYSDGWALTTALDVFDHMLAFGYGRPLTADRPPAATDHELPTDLKLTGILALSELIPAMRRIIRWTSSRQRDEHSLHNLLDSVNEVLDGWFFRWMSPASEMVTDLPAFIVVIGHHVRLGLNILTLKSESNADTPFQSRARRLALIAATEIIDLFETDVKSPTLPRASLRCAPQVTASILAHATLTLTPFSVRRKGSATACDTLYSGDRATTVTRRYFDKGFALLKSGQIHQGHYTPTLARTIEELVRASPAPVVQTPCVPLEQLNPIPNLNPLHTDLMASPRNEPSLQATLWPAFSFDDTYDLLGWFGNESGLDF